MQTGWNFHHRYDPWNDAFALFMRFTDYNGRRWKVKTLELEAMGEKGGFELNPIPTLGSYAEEGKAGDVKGFMQALLDEAWKAGMRPTDYAETTNELAAVRYHLEDMRKLAKVK